MKVDVFDRFPLMCVVLTWPMVKAIATVSHTVQVAAHVRYLPTTYRGRRVRYLPTAAVPGCTSLHPIELRASQVDDRAHLGFCSPAGLPPDSILNESAGRGGV